MATHVELTTPHRSPRMLSVHNLDELSAVAAQDLGGSNFTLLLVGTEEELTSLDGRTAIQVVAHPCRKAVLTVAADSEKSDTFPVSQTVRKVLDWAVGKKGFNLDDNQAAKANLVLASKPDEPLPKSALIGQYVDAQTCSAAFQLSLKDFSNG
ncbi:hypothetical protein JJB11_21415 [Ramlibacter ginsenosidimutans]|uniref:Uncharacterized protein n=1 Tax=Ramlibacter ginsenosidimutans TaxID=502333 RepID=A0A934TWD4_9BURK|nr:hypothetical protein [Ramlibacter ginsenosidimutans]MBK6008668.1 hypothetical protein [Ramlibacter ginsenosidimutans]